MCVLISLSLSLRYAAVLPGVRELPESSQHVREHGRLTQNALLLPLLKRYQSVCLSLPLSLPAPLCIYIHWHTHPCSGTHTHAHTHTHTQTHTCPCTNKHVLSPTDKHACQRLCFTSRVKPIRNLTYPTPPQPSSASAVVSVCSADSRYLACQGPAAFKCTGAPCTTSLLELILASVHHSNYQFTTNTDGRRSFGGF